jgi:hypothetical protein
MSRRAAAQLAFLLTLACVLLLPVRAQAALLPTCDASELASTIVPPDEPTCTVVMRVVDQATGATTAAPICDPRGASAIAPPRILPVDDARIKATPAPCGEAGLAPLSGPDARSAPHAAPAALADYALETSPPLVPPAPLTGTLERIAGNVRPLHGFVRDIEHPPR